MVWRDGVRNDARFHARQIGVRLGVGAHFEIEFGDAIGGVRGKFAILGLKCDRDEISPARRSHLQPVLIGFEDPVLRALSRGIMQDAKKDEGAETGSDAPRQRIEFRIVFDAEILDRPAAEIARRDEPRLARGGARVQKRKVCPKADQARVPGADQNLRFGAISRRLKAQHDADENERGERQPNQPPFPGGDRFENQAKIQLAGTRCAQPVPLPPAHKPPPPSKQRDKTPLWFQRG